MLRGALFDAAGRRPDFVVPRAVRKHGLFWRSAPVRAEFCQKGNCPHRPAGQIWAGPHPKGAQSSTGPGDWQGARDRTGHPHPVPSQQEQPLSGRRSGRWQNCHRRRACPADCTGQGSACAIGQAADFAGFGVDGGRYQIPRRI